MIPKRQSSENYFMAISIMVGARSTCIRRKIGALFVKDDKIVSTGYNGAPRGHKHCIDRGSCLRDELKIKSGTNQETCFAVHAEQNAIINAAVQTGGIKGADLYCETFPCSVCARMLVNAQIRRIFYVKDYTDSKARGFIREAKIQVVKLKHPHDILVQINPALSKPKQAKIPKRAIKKEFPKCSFCGDNQFSYVLNFPHDPMMVYLRKLSTGEWICSRCFQDSDVANDDLGEKSCDYCDKSSYSNTINNPFAPLILIRELADGSNVCEECFLSRLC